MFVILVYDVSSRHNKRVSSVCEAFLTRTQRSVFEGQLTERHLRMLKQQLKPLIDGENETITIYTIANPSNIEKQSLGSIPVKDL